MSKNSNSQGKPQRSVLITISCILAIFNTLMSIQEINQNDFGFYNLVSNVMVSICIIGIWKMKVWAVFIYLSVFLVNQLTLILSEQWRFYQIIIPLIIIAIALKYLNEMSI